MDSVLSVLFKVLGLVVILMAASDILNWSLTSNYENNSANFIENLASDVVNLPSTIICYVLNMVLQLVEFAVKAVFDLVGIDVDASMTGIPCSM